MFAIPRTWVEVNGEALRTLSLHEPASLLKQAVSADGVKTSVRLRRVVFNPCTQGREHGAPDFGGENGDYRSEGLHSISTVGMTGLLRKQLSRVEVNG